MSTSIAQAAGILEVDLAAIAENYRRLCRKAAGVEVAAAVKANAYGLGAREIVPVLLAQGCRLFFVAHLREAFDLRDLIPARAQISILNGLPPGTEDLAAQSEVLPVLNSLAQISRWRDTARRLGRALPAILQVDSGMSRFGLSEMEVAQLAAAPDLLAGVQVELVMSHLAVAEATDHPANELQREKFESLRRLLPEAPASLANSSGIFLRTDFHFDIVRAGAALYGVNPTPNLDNPMRGVAWVKARFVQMRQIAAGTGVGYGLTFRAPQERWIGTLSLGYADGWHRSLSGKGRCWFQGRSFPFVGRVSMDSILIDLGTDPPEIAEGDWVELLGDHIPVDEVAEAAGTIGYEVLTSLGARLHRIYLSSASA